MNETIDGGEVVKKREFSTKLKVLKELKKPKMKPKTGRGNVILSNKVGVYPMTPKRRAMINQTVTALIEAKGNKRLASEMLDISEQSLFKRFKTYPEILKKYEDFNNQIVILAREQLKNHALQATDRVIDLSQSAISERTKLEANLEILDRSGIVKPTESSANVQVNVLNAIKEDSNKFDL